jgi:hypothetical protein
VRGQPEGRRRSHQEDRISLRLAGRDEALVNTDAPQVKNEGRSERWFLRDKAVAKPTKLLTLVDLPVEVTGTDES